MKETLLKCNNLEGPSQVDDIYEEINNANDSIKTLPIYQSRRTSKSNDSKNNLQLKMK